MSDHSEHKGDHHIPFESEAAIIHGAANEEERQKAEEQEREKEYKRRDDAFKERQVAIAERQLTENSRISKFTLALVIVSLLGSSVALYQAYVSGISSRAALSAAENAESTLIEQRRLREQSASESQYAREASAAETDAADQRNMAALKASAEQSRQALDTSIKAMQLTLRPYLVAGALRLAGEFTGDKNFVGHIGVINAGHTPATHVDGCSDLIFRPQSRPITDDEPCPSPENPPAINHTQPTGEHSISVIGPNLPPFDMVSPGSMVSVSADGVPITSAEKLKLFSPGGGFLLYLYGELTYSDILGTGKTYHSKFCGRYNPTTNTFDSCEKHNQVN